MALAVRARALESDRAVLEPSAPTACCDLILLMSTMGELYRLKNLMWKAYRPMLSR